MLWTARVASPRRCSFCRFTAVPFIQSRLLNFRHKEEVLENLKCADYVLFVMKATSPGTATEGELRELLSNYDTPGILVLSHWDGLDTDEERKEVEDSAKSFAAKAFPGKQTELFFINGKEAEKAIKCGEQHNEPACLKLESFLEEKLTDKTAQLNLQLKTFRSQGRVIVEKRLSHIQSDRAQEQAAHEEAMGGFKQTEAKLSERNRSLTDERHRLDKEEKDLTRKEEEATKDLREHLEHLEHEYKEDGGAIMGAIKCGSEAGAAAGVGGGLGGPQVGAALAVVAAVAFGIWGGVEGHQRKNEKERMKNKAAKTLQDKKDLYTPRKEEVKAERNKLTGREEVNKEEQEKNQADCEAAKRQFEEKMEALSQEEQVLEGLLLRLLEWEPAKEF